MSNYDLSTMTDHELAQLLRALNERRANDTYAQVRAIVQEITRRQKEINR